MTVLFVIIESGIIYTSLWVIYVFIGWFSVGGYIYSDFWMIQISVRDHSFFSYTDALSTFLSQGMYPALVVVMVLLRDSLLEQSASPGSEDAGALAHPVTNCTEVVDLRTPSTPASTKSQLLPP